MVDQPSTLDLREKIGIAGHEVAALVNFDWSNVHRSIGNAPIHHAINREMQKQRFAVMVAIFMNHEGVSVRDKKSFAFMQVASFETEEMAQTLAEELRNRPVSERLHHPDAQPGQPTLRFWDYFVVNTNRLLLGPFKYTDFKERHYHPDQGEFAQYMNKKIGIINRNTEEMEEEALSRTKAVSHLSNESEKAYWESHMDMEMADPKQRLKSALDAKKRMRNRFAS